MTQTQFEVTSLIPWSQTRIKEHKTYHAVQVRGKHTKWTTIGIFPARSLAVGFEQCLLLAANLYEGEREVDQ